MEQRGFIRDTLDIKILILFILSRLPGPVREMDLAGLATFDGGFTWFDYTECLEDLVRRGQITRENGCFEVTEPGRQNAELLASGLPYSVRARAERLTASAAARMRRERQIETAAEPQENGALSVSMRLSDGVGEVIALRLSLPDEDTAERVTARFRRDAEKIYNRFIDILLEE